MKFISKLFKKSSVEPHPDEIKKDLEYRYLIISMIGGHKIEYRWDDREDPEDDNMEYSAGRLPWCDFILWYHKKKSPSYTFYLSDEIRTVSRASIESFKICNLHNIKENNK